MDATGQTVLRESRHLSVQVARFEATVSRQLEQLVARLDRVDDIIGSVNVPIYNTEQETGRALADINYDVRAMHSQLNERFSGVGDMFKDLGERFETLDGQYKDVDEWFGEIDGKIDSLDERLDEVERAGGLLEYGFNEEDLNDVLKEQLQSVKVLIRKFAENDRLWYDALCVRASNLSMHVEGLSEEFEKQLQGVNQAVKQTNDDMQDLLAEQSNFKAVMANRVLRRIYQPINPIKVKVSTTEQAANPWQGHAKMPKNMKALFCLGQHAKNVFEPGFKGQKKRAATQALKTLRELVKFYGVVLYSDEQGDADENAVDVKSDVDGYMEILLDTWGLDWENVCSIVEEALRESPPQQQAGVKRAPSSCAELPTPTRRRRS